ncbi:protein kinase-like protein [Purpureocillium lilacinum]|uniref:Protein kinase-like protein n=1 Tax=Purpureocillium lilacinum TaxID=33203 RepID=A0A179GLV7_PURLI|nr:protein kinase-like protein [Purpureocillium lilacinum]
MDDDNGNGGWSDSVDYQAYLSGLYPGTTWSLARLAGGLVNRTLRATLVSGAAPHRSLIVKHARPYVETAGPAWAFSTDRQAVEAAVLALWHHPEGALAPFRALRRDDADYDDDDDDFSNSNDTPAWHIPELIRHDRGPESALRLTPSARESSVLLLGDLGPLVNIVEFLLRAGSSSRDGADAEQIDAIATAVGRAFAVLHSPQLAARIVSQPDAAAARLTHHLGRDVVRRACIEPLLARLSAPSRVGGGGGGGNDDGARRLYDRVVADFEGPEGYSYRECFTLGDFTPGSILLRDDALAPDGTQCDRTPIIVDWEFAQLNGRGVNGDMAQFLASMHCEILAASASASASSNNNNHIDGNNNGPTAHARLVRFVRAFCGAYRSSAGLRCRRDATDPDARLLRSALIMHGREVVNQAHDMHAASPRFAAMVSRGAACIELAEDDMAAFVDAANWARLIRSEAGDLVVSLFDVES